MSGNRRIGSLLSLGVALLVALILFASPASAVASPIRLGAFTTNSPADGKVMDEYSSMVGRNPDIVMFYKAFGVPLMTEQQSANLKARGATPMVTWEPSQPTSGYPAANLAEIAEGKFDSYIREAAVLAKGYSSEVMIRFAHEMNISASLWGPGKDGNVGNTYVEAWRHVVSIFREEGATNVKWVWSPNVDWGGVPFAQYFPGDSWVDYVALDGYNWGVVGTERWQSMSQLFASSYATLTQMSTKPVIFAETSCGEVGGSKAAWIREGFLHTIPTDFPRVAAVIWFNSVAEEDWRIATSSSALEAYREVVASSPYGGSNPVSTEPEPAPPELTALKVTPSKTSASRKTSKRTKVVYRLTRNAPIRLMLRRVEGAKLRVGRVIAVANSRRKGVVSLSRMLHGRALQPGKYVVIATLTGGEANTAEPRRTRFEIVTPQHAETGLASAKSAA